jgi:two-component SAPR family response regulator
MAPQIDFLEFKSLIHQASKGTDRVALYKKAIALYTGDFLKEDLYAEWSVFERESLKDSYLHALAYLAQHALEHEDEAEAVLYARQLIDTDRTDDKGYEILLRIFLKQGNHSEARRIYAQCKEAFAKELGSAPPMHLHALVSHSAVGILRRTALLRKTPATALLVPPNSACSRASRHSASILL